MSQSKQTALAKNPAQLKRYNYDLGWTEWRV